MNDQAERDKVFAAVRHALAKDREGMALPDYDESLLVAETRLQAEGLWENFAVNCRAVNGHFMRSVAELGAFLQEYDYRRGFCDPTLQAEVGDPLEPLGIEVLTSFERERHNDYTFGITRATGAIAESGTVILNDFDTVDRLAALAPWVHVAVLRPEEIVRTIPEAIGNLGSAPNVVWVTGPSKTGDIEGILIEGVHGPGEQVCLCLGAGD